MADDIAGFPYLEAQFGRDAALLDPPDPARIPTWLAGTGATDLLAISHGWNNDIADARTLYQAFFGRVRTALGGGGLGGRRIAVLGIFWPSKRFADEELIPGGAASAAGGEEPVIGAQLDRLTEIVGPARAGALAEARQLLGTLGDNPAGQRRFVDLIRSTLSRPTDPTDAASDLFFAMPGDEVLDKLSPPIRPRRPAAGDEGGATGLPPDQGGAAGLLTDLGRGIQSAVRRLLNFSTYHEMKERAG